jgi:hypothetical protein
MVPKPDVIGQVMASAIRSPPPKIKKWHSELIRTGLNKSKTRSVALTAPKQLLAVPAFGAADRHCTGQHR